MYGIDSLTDGASGNSFREEFQKVHTQLNDKVEIGYVHLDYSSSKAQKIGFYKSSGFQEMARAESFSIAPIKYSISGKGIYGFDLKNEGFSYNTKTRSFDTARIYYLQQPDGGSFSYRLGNQEKNGSKKIDMSGKEDIKWIEVSNTDSSNRLIIVNKVNGNAAFFGIQYYSINSTVSYCNISKGGMKLAKIMKLDSEYRKKWFGILQPKTLLLNAGTNDRIDTNVQQFKKQLNQYITDVKSGSPDTKMILIEPNQPEDYLTTNAIYFEKARKITATKHQLQLIDIPKTIGNHQFFVDNKLMTDAIHPNKGGFKRIALEVNKQL
jgi:hypothetical protein